MALNYVEPQAIYDVDNDDNSTAYTANTPPETVVGDLLDDDHPPKGAESSSSVPWPGSTFIIRSVSSGHVLTLLDGKIMLASPGGPGSIHWACVESKGWLGFRNTVSGKFLGHAENGTLRCSAKNHLGWEYFCVRMRPEGGYVLYMTHWERLWQVGMKEDWGVQKLAKIEKDGIVWEFVKV